MKFNHQRYPALISFILFSAGIISGWSSGKVVIFLLFITISTILIFFRIFPYIILFLLGILYVNVEKYRLNLLDLDDLTRKKVMVRGKIVDEKFLITDLIRTATTVYHVKTRFYIKTELPCGEILATGKVYLPEERFRMYLISNRASGVFKPFLMSKKRGCGIKDKLRRILWENAWNFENYQIMRALILAERKDIPQPVSDLFKRTGTMHVLALSGLHVGIITIVLATLFMLLRIPERYSLIVTLVFLTGFLFMIGIRSSLLRAYIFFVSLIVARLLYRKIDYLNVWGFAGLMSLAFNPLWIFNIGFQFSYIATLGIILSISSPVKGWKSSVLNGFISSSSATLFVSPLQMYYFKIFTPIAILANVVVIPLVFVILSELIIGVIFSFLGIQVLGRIFFNTGNLAILLLLKSLKFLNHIPLSFTYQESPFNGLQVIISVAFLTALFGWSRIFVSEMDKPDDRKSHRK